jgi:Zn-dependent M28 family amino/carboxypeptidase
MVSDVISEARFREHIRTLASPAFAGRAPGSDGERLTVDYLCAEFRALGLAPGNGDRYVQSMPMIETQVDTRCTLAVHAGNAHVELAFGIDMVIGNTGGERDVAVDGSELVFIGYGIHAPERGWDDYRGVDVRGKTVVMLVNDPGFHTGDDELFSGPRMTPFGRWTYKFAEAARQGALAALIIHEDAAAGYGWDVVVAGAAGPRFSLPVEVDPAPRLPLQGWLSADAATAVFAAAGVDLAALRQTATRQGFSAVTLDARLSTAVRSDVAHGESSNVLGMIRGRTRPDEVVMYCAHWDHLGCKRAEDGRDEIRAGAIDNGTGVAAVLEIARAFTALPEAPERSVVFVSFTLEESGLLGAQYLVSHLPWPLANTVAVLNFDAMDPDFDNRAELPLVGFGSSTLEDMLTPVLARQGRTLVDEPSPEKGYFFRSDHYCFALAGVPALVAGLNMSPGYAQRYHKPTDVYDEGWNLTGVLQDVDAWFEVGRALAFGDAWPQWYPDHPFRAAADALGTDRRGARSR